MFLKNKIKKKEQEALPHLGTSSNELTSHIPEVPDMSTDSAMV